VTGRPSPAPPVAPRLVVRLKKGRDGSATLSCTRADGSVTWQRNDGARARYFPLHDLTHLAVETELGARRAFYGLVADGWELADFGTPWPRGPLPPEAEAVERVVGLLDTARAQGRTWTGAELAAELAHAHAAHGLASTPPTITDEALARIHRRMHELFAQWDAVPPGEALELPFAPGAR